MIAKGVPRSQMRILEEQLIVIRECKEGFMNVREDLTHLHEHGSPSTNIKKKGDGWALQTLSLCERGSGIVNAKGRGLEASQT